MNFFNFIRNCCYLIHFACYIQDLENYLRNHSESRVEKLKEIGEDLITLDFMKENINSELQTVSERWDLLHHQVSVVTNKQFFLAS